MSISLKENDYLFYLYTDHSSPSDVAYQALIDISQSFHPISMEEIIRNSLDKPIVKDNPFYFSISHSNALIIIGISLSPIGVDCEFHKKRNFTGMIHKTFSDEEKRQYEMNPSLSSFYMIWCQKEALLKYTGIGIRHPNLKEVNTCNVPEYLRFKEKRYILPPKLVTHKSTKYSLAVAHHKPLIIQDIKKLTY